MSEEEEERTWWEPFKGTFKTPVHWWRRAVSVSRGLQTIPSRNATVLSPAAYSGQALTEEASVLVPLGVRCANSSCCWPLRSCVLLSPLSPESEFRELQTWETSLRSPSPSPTWCGRSPTPAHAQTLPTAGSVLLMRQHLPFLKGLCSQEGFI